MKNNETWIRYPAVAGRFYPSDKRELEDQVRAMLVPFSSSLARETAAVLTPHAGYMYSGKLAAQAHASWRIPPVVILLGPNHTGRGARISVWSEGEWLTPLGKVSISATVANEVLQRIPQASSDIHAHLAEHSLEVQIPFMQILRADVQIVPIILGPLSMESCVEIGEALADILSITPDIGLMISTDMSHYISAGRAQELDRLALAEWERVSPEGLFETVRSQQISMCGYIPTTVGLAAARRLGVKSAEILAYGNSGQVTGDTASVVGYAAGRLGPRTDS